MNRGRCLSKKIKYTELQINRGHNPDHKTPQAPLGPLYPPLPVVDGLGIYSLLTALKGYCGVRRTKAQDDGQQSRIKPSDEALAAQSCVPAHAKCYVVFGDGTLRDVLADDSDALPAYGCLFERPSRHHVGRPRRRTRAHACATTGRAAHRRGKRDACDQRAARFDRLLRTCACENARFRIRAPWALWEGGASAGSRGDVCVLVTSLSDAGKAFEFVGRHSLVSGAAIACASSGELGYKRMPLL